MDKYIYVYVKRVVGWIVKLFLYNYNICFYCMCYVMVKKFKLYVFNGL